MDKDLVFQQFLSALKTQLETAERAANQAYESATHQENVAENKYDTLGLEASYLAEGQAKRVTQCRQALSKAKQLFDKKTPQGETIQVGSLVSLCSAENDKRLFLISPVAGGTRLDVGAQNITVLTPSSPLGKQLIGRHVLDEVVLSIQSRHQHFEIEAIY